MYGVDRLYKTLLSKINALIFSPIIVYWTVNMNCWKLIIIKYFDLFSHRLCSKR